MVIRDLLLDLILSLPEFFLFLLFLAELILRLMIGLGFLGISLFVVLLHSLFELLSPPLSLLFLLLLSFVFFFLLQFELLDLGNLLFESLLTESLDLLHRFQSVRSADSSLFRGCTGHIAVTTRAVSDGERLRRDRPGCEAGDVQALGVLFERKLLLGRQLNGRDLVLCLEMLTG